MGRLFGTDGIRGVANTELSVQLCVKIGRAAAMVLSEATGGMPRVLIGADTRISGDMLVCAMTAGLLSVGACVTNAGVLPTPAVAYLVKNNAYDAGVMVSASHNPCEYNGIKIFNAQGYKLPDEVEDRIEELILDDTFVFPQIIGGAVGSAFSDMSAVDDYAKHLLVCARGHFTGKTFAFDCANGAASATAQKVFPFLGAQCLFLSKEPDGTNINRNCGSTHMEQLQEYVLSHGCDAGFAFDGDADRLLAVDERGRLVDGDRIMAILARHMKEKGTLQKNTLVTTVMSNMGLFEFLKKYDIRSEKTKVGDRYVLENMLANSYNLGGEQSGHIIFSDFSTTGDGQLSAILLLNCLWESGASLAELSDDIEIFPQEMINVRVSAYGKLRLGEDEEIKTAIEKAQAELGESGRVLVRASGTEPLVRVMMEGRDGGQIRHLCEEVAEVVRERLI
ncbi:MAG: phosphoglucosamine mutase [Oscillospiraceae bacterium]|jgi:phosphoglucosamine mutase|nr:phosphoglucosamine mutase [Oscillospiraceae bacterium]